MVENHDPTPNASPQSDLPGPATKHPTETNADGFFGPSDRPSTEAELLYIHGRRVAEKLAKSTLAYFDPHDTA